MANYTTSSWSRTFLVRHLDCSAAAHVLKQCFENVSAEMKFHVVTRFLRQLVSTSSTMTELTPIAVKASDVMLSFWPVKKVFYWTFDRHHTRWFSLSNRVLSRVMSTNYNANEEIFSSMGILFVNVTRRLCSYSSHVFYIKAYHSYLIKTRFLSITSVDWWCTGDDLLSTSPESAVELW